MADVLAGRTPIDIGVEIVRRQRGRAVGEVLLMAKLVAEPDLRLLLANDETEIGLYRQAIALCSPG
jgi:hypothetical protein